MVKTMRRSLPVIGALFRYFGVGVNEFEGCTVRPDILHGTTVKNRMDVVHGALNPIYLMCDTRPGYVHVEFAGRSACLRDGEKIALEGRIHDELIENLARFNYDTEILGKV